jgi:hypothetical protein
VPSRVLMTWVWYQRIGYVERGVSGIRAVVLESLKRVAGDCYAGDLTMIIT